MRKFILTLIVAAIGSAAAAPFGPAAARYEMNWCGAGLGTCYYNCSNIEFDPDHSKFKACQEQCMSAYNRCVRLHATMPSKDFSQTKARPAVQPPAGGSGMVGTGILDSSPGLFGQGPAAAGSPVGGGRPAAAPSAPPVIIR